MLRRLQSTSLSLRPLLPLKTLVHFKPATERPPSCAQRASQPGQCPVRKFTGALADSQNWERKKNHHLWMLGKNTCNAFFPKHPYLFSSFPQFLNICCPEAKAKVFFETCDLMFVPHQPGALHSLSQHTSMLTTKEKIIQLTHMHPESLNSVLSLFVAVIMTVVPPWCMKKQGVQLNLWGAVASISTREKHGYQACGEAALCW